MSNFTDLPANLPVPIDDGAANHLLGKSLPSLTLESTHGPPVDLAALPGRVVVFCYPRTGRPDQPMPDHWDTIPGARGCTPQACSFRDHFQELRTAGASSIFGVSTQTTDYQKEAATRLQLPYPLLSDSELRFGRSLQLPTFTVEGITLLKRLTIVTDDARIVKIFYPVFPPNESAETTMAWLRGKT